MVLAAEPDYLPGMTGLASLETCLARALDGVLPVAPVSCEPAAACGSVLADDIRLPRDMPPLAEALRAGLAVAALDLVGASAGAPVPLGGVRRVIPGEVLPGGTDAVLPDDGIDTANGQPEAIRAPNPGDGVRRAGHDGRAGDLVAAAGTRLGPRGALAAALSGLGAVSVRRPRVAVALDDPAQAALARAWLAAAGAEPVIGAADLTLQTATDPAPRLALTPAETGWLARTGGGLVLTLPARFDGMVAAFLALGLPAIAALTGAAPQARARPLARKIASAIGVSDLVLLADAGGQWLPGPAGAITLTRLAGARAFAILPPDSEGLPAGATLSGTLLDHPFGALT